MLIGSVANRSDCVELIGIHFHAFDLQLAIIRPKQKRVVVGSCPSHIATQGNGMGNDELLQVSVRV